MKDLSKTELLIMKCVWGSDHPVTATQIQQILLEKYHVMDVKTFLFFMVQ